MRKIQVVQVLAVALVIDAQAARASAQVATSDLGTDSVSFQPLQRRGTLHGCSLVYSAFTRDAVYRDAKLVFVVGNVSVVARPDSIITSFKIGLKDLEGGPSKFAEPHFAYLQTANATTAKVPHVVDSADEGFRLFIFDFAGPASDVLLDVMRTKKVTIGFNRRLDGLDVVVPLDLTVASTTYNDDGSVLRQRSDDAVESFATCVARVLETFTSAKKP